jgi:alcohol dehydrogenase (cytochrome c)
VSGLVNAREPWEPCGSARQVLLARESAARGTGGGLVFLALLDGTVAAYDDATLDELWKINVGSGFSAPPMTFEVNGKQFIAIASGLGAAAKVKLANSPERRDQRNATVLYVFV